MKSRKRETEDFSFRPFRNLKTIINAGEIKPVAREHTPVTDPVPCDHDLFRIEMKGVREIKEFRKIPVRQRVVAPVLKRDDPEKEALKTLDEITRGRRPIRLEDTQEYVEWVNSDYSSAPAIAKKLHEGRFAVQDFLDLHGFTLDEAEVQVSEFIRISLIKGLSCIKIIHGRGLKSPHGPVLKEAVVKWLSGRYRKNVMAFATARQYDGGLGALYILLKRRQVGKK